MSSKITIETDYLILGSAPNILRKPSLEELEIYPDAMEKYEGSLKEAADYNEIRDKAKTLSIPVFNLERFLYFIGYKTRSGQSGAY